MVQRSSKYQNEDDKKICDIIFYSIPIVVVRMLKYIRTVLGG
jgi:hypothetical protein